MNADAIAKALQTGEDYVRDHSEGLTREEAMSLANAVFIPACAELAVIEKQYKQDQQQIAVKDAVLRKVLSYLPAQDGLRTGEPDGDVQLMICDEIKAALTTADPGKVLVSLKRVKKMHQIGVLEMTLEMDRHNPLVVLRDWFAMLLRENGNKS